MLARRREVTANAARSVALNVAADESVAVSENEDGAAAGLDPVDRVSILPSDICSLVFGNGRGLGRGECPCCWAERMMVMIGLIAAVQQDSRLSRATREV